MISIANQPNLTDLHDFIRQIPHYPISANHLVGLASKLPYHREIVDFYQSFADDQIFENEDDLAARTELVEILNHQDAPVEPVRGAED